jgi:hypothetical protein
MYVYHKKSIGMFLFFIVSIIYQIIGFVAIKSYNEYPDGKIFIGLNVGFNIFNYLISVYFINKYMVIDESEKLSHFFLSLIGE